MSAPRNATPTPHRGIASVPPIGRVREPDYQGRHRFTEGRTLAQFTVAHLQKVCQPAAR